MSAADETLIPLMPFVISSTGRLHKPTSHRSTATCCGSVRCGMPVLVHVDDIGRRLCATCFPGVRSPWMLAVTR